MGQSTHSTVSSCRAGGAGCPQDAVPALLRGAALHRAAASPGLPAPLPSSLTPRAVFRGAGCRPGAGRGWQCHMLCQHEAAPLLALGHARNWGCVCPAVGRRPQGLSSRVTPWPPTPVSACPAAAGSTLGPCPFVWGHRAAPQSLPTHRISRCLLPCPEHHELALL